jgi:hypothetical protein
MPKLSHSELVAEFRYSHTAPNGSEVWVPKTRMIDCDSCGDWYDEDGVYACNADGGAYCQACHAGCKCLTY